jgi:transcriptional regulator with XRE-family HTH domain
VHLLYTDESGASTNANHYVLAGISAFERKPYYLSQGHVEQATGLQRAYLSRVENGRTEPQLAQMKRIADALGMPLWSIIKVWEEQP